METAVQSCVRVADALTDLVTQESAALEAHDYATVLELQERTAPLVEFLVAHGATHAGDIRVQKSVSAVQELRTRTAERLAAEIQSTRVEWQAAGRAQRQAAKIVPAYGRFAAASARLVAVG